VQILGGRVIAHNHCWCQKARLIAVSYGINDVVANTVGSCIIPEINMAAAQTETNTISADIYFSGIMRLLVVLATTSLNRATSKIWM